MKRNKQLSLAQALGNLSNIDPDKLIGRNVVIERLVNNRNGTRLKRKKIIRGYIKEYARDPDFVIIEDEKGGKYSRHLSHVWRDIL